ncbi:MAG: hypothetical protein JWP78_2239 [Mucilaginibacter sp.]|nr:hypothetical protein [Mucilaginibacter sp.]
MEDFDFKLTLHDNQLAVSVHPYEEGDKTYYDILFEDYSISIYKDTLYTWTSDEPHGLSHADIQSLGEQIDNRR